MTISLKIVDLEERIAPAVPAPIDYSGAGLHLPNGKIVPQDRISGEGIGPGSPGAADGNGPLLRNFGTPG